MYNETVYSRAVLTLLAALALPGVKMANVASSRLRIRQARRQLKQAKSDLQFDCLPYASNLSGR
jgi:hypothetical protein